MAKETESGVGMEREGLWGAVGSCGREGVHWEDTEGEEVRGVADKK